MLPQQPTTDIHNYASQLKQRNRDYKTNISWRSAMKTGWSGKPNTTVQIY